MSISNPMPKSAEYNEEFLEFGSWNWNPKTNVLMWSKGLYVLMDLNPATETSAITMDFYRSFVLGDGCEIMDSALAEAKSNRAATMEYKHCVKTRSREKSFYTKAEIRYDVEGEVIEITGLTRDITEAARLTEDLGHYKQMVVQREDFLGHGSWELDLSGNDTMWWSDGMFRLFGYDPAQDKLRLEINKELYRTHVTEEVFEDSIVNLKAALAGGGSTYAWSFEIMTKAGATRLLESFGGIIRDKTGRATKILGTTRDVTQLRKYEHDLDEKILELDRLSKELEDSAYAASHDLQEPLRKISTLSDRLQSKFNEVLPEDGKKYIERIQVATKNARLLIDSLLEFSRVTHETHLFRKTDLNVLLQEVKADLELKIEETHTTIECGKLPILECSSLQIKQLFSNILLNSIKFRKEGVLPIINIQSIKLEKQEKQERHLNGDVSYFRIIISDNGIGFEETFSAKIFQMFSRLNGKSEYPGAGIGLALCKKIVENHKGQIFAASVPGHGATFSVVLPEKTNG